MTEKEIDLVCPANPDEWRQWLIENHESKQSVWLVQYKKQAGKPTISWSEAVDEALCFGWIDSKKKPMDNEKFMQFFSKRKKTGTWSKINKEKIERLTQEGRMSLAGIECIEAAKQNGSWTILDDVEALNLPEDLEEELKRQDGSMDYFLGLSKSVRKRIFLWLVLAKRSETREKRIREISEMAHLRLKTLPFGA